MPAPLLFTLAPAEPAFEIGEPVWLVLGVENHSSAPVDGTVETNLRLRTDDLFVTVTGPDGQAVPDPWRHRPPCCASNSFGTAEAAPGESAELRIDLAKYAWLDVPGRYEVRLLSPFHVTREAPPPSDPRWVTTRVTMKAPSDPRALVQSIPRTLDDAHREREKRGLEWSRIDVNTYEGLGHVLYVPILEELAAASAADPDYPWGDERYREWDAVDQRDLYGLAACPCPEATEALLRLFDHFEHDAAHRKQVMAELSLRMPRRPAAESWFVSRAWSPELDDDVLLRARRVLEAPSSSPGWSEAASWGADVVRRLGSSADAELLAKAMDHTLALPESLGRFGTSPSAEVVRSLEWALAEHPPASTTGLSDHAALMVELQAWDGRTGSPPPGWEAVVLRALATSEPDIVASATGRLPHPASPALMRAILPHVGSAQMTVAHHLLGYVRRSPPNEALFVPMLLAELETAATSRVVGLLDVLHLYLPLDAWLDLVLARFPFDPTNQDLLRMPTRALSRCPLGGGMGPIPPAEIPALWGAWQNALATRRSELRHGPLPIVPGVTDPALAPAAYTCTLAPGEVWPSR